MRSSLLESQARFALSIETKEERIMYLGDNEALRAKVAEFWGGGSICARCAYFVPLGKPDSGLNGVCHKVLKDRYTRPEESCERFQGKKTSKE